MSSLLLALAMAISAPKPNYIAPLDTEDRCFIERMCELKEMVRWKTPRWSMDMCYRVGNAIIAEEHVSGVPRELILAVMINESDMNDKATRPYFDKNGKMTSWDGGLMGVRCIVDKDGRSCVNYMRKVTWKDLLVPEVSLRLAVRKMVSIRDQYPCKHNDHPWFAHYNWGGKVIRTGIPRSYPQRVAVLWKALAEAGGKEPPEIAQLRFVQIKGKRPVTINTPVGARHRDLVSKIKACRTCKQTELAMQ